eukprot:356516-Chlamydomonas_euryale.AAC.4
MPPPPLPMPPLPMPPLPVALTPPLLLSPPLVPLLAASGDASGDSSSKPNAARSEIEEKTEPPAPTALLSTYPPAAPTALASAPAAAPTTNGDRLVAGDACDRRACRSGPESAECGRPPLLRWRPPPPAAPAPALEPLPREECSTTASVW